MSSAGYYAFDAGARQHEEKTAGAFIPGHQFPHLAEHTAVFDATKEYVIPIQSTTAIPVVKPPPGAGSSLPEIRELVFIISSNSNARDAMRRLLEREHFNVREAGWNEQIPSLMNDVSVVLVDINAKNPQNDAVCNQISARFPDVPIIVMDDQTSDQDFRRSSFKYAAAYLTKQCDRHQILSTVHQTTKSYRLSRDNKQLKQLLGHPIIPYPSPGISLASQTLSKQIEAFGRIDATVLISGERGIGKHIVAQKIHQASSRAREPFLVFPCRSLPSEVMEVDFFGDVQAMLDDRIPERPGKLKMLSRGTILLDEIEYLTTHQQARLYAFLQDRAYRPIGATGTQTSETRILATTRGGLAVACAQGRFREDLFFRTSSMTLTVPPLRERLDDIQPFSSDILMQVARQVGSNQPILTAGAIQKMKQYAWPGNIRELESVLYNGMVSAKDTIITEADIIFDPIFSEGTRPDGSIGLAGLTMSDIERRAIIETIYSCGGNRSQAALKLGISEKTIYNKIKLYKLRGIV